MQSTKWLFVID